MEWETYCAMEKENDFKEAVKECLRKLEEKHKIKVVVGSDTGSRSCNIHSFNSDLDVHFIYGFTDLQSYFSIKSIPDILTIQDKVVLKDGSEIEINCSGWEMRKACQLLATSNAAIVELIHHSILPQNQFSDHLIHNPFFETQEIPQENILKTRMSFVKLGFHYRSISYTIQKKKLPLSEVETATKNYLNMIRYINLTQQLINILNRTGLEYNNYMEIKPEDLSVLSEQLIQTQKDLLEKRRRRIWNIPRDLELEKLLQTILDDHLEFLKSFTETSTDENLNSDKQKDILFDTCDTICKDVIMKLVE